jgi:hypothetical protein
MYGKTGIVGGAGGLAATGFGVTWYVVLASLLIIGGLLFARWGLRRGAAH